MLAVDGLCVLCLSWEFRTSKITKHASSMPQALPVKWFSLCSNAVVEWIYRFTCKSTTLMFDNHNYRVQTRIHERTWCQSADCMVWKVMFTTLFAFCWTGVQQDSISEPANRHWECPGSSGEIGARSGHQTRPIKETNKLIKFHSCRSLLGSSLMCHMLWCAPCMSCCAETHMPR